MMRTAEPVSADTRSAFFETAAGDWDRRIRPADHSAIEKIFSRIPFSKTDTVLDVGAGTGIMIPYYKRCGIKEIYALDSSDRMVGILNEKFPDITIFHRSYLEPLSMTSFADKIMIFNTFPHFTSFEPVFRNSADYLTTGGRLIIAHSMSRRALAECHGRKGGCIAEDLLPPDEFFRRMFREHGFSDITVEDSPDGFFAAGRLTYF